LLEPLLRSFIAIFFSYEESCLNPSLAGTTSPIYKCIKEFIFNKFCLNPSLAGTTSPMGQGDLTGSCLRSLNPSLAGTTSPILHKKYFLKYAEVS